MAATQIQTDSGALGDKALGARRIAVDLLAEEIAQLGASVSKSWWRWDFLAALVIALGWVGLWAAVLSSLHVEKDEWLAGLLVLSTFFLPVGWMLARIPGARGKLSSAQRARLQLEHDTYLEPEVNGFRFPGSDHLALRRAENLIEWVDIERRVDLQAHVRNVLAALLVALPAVAGAAVVSQVEVDNTSYSTYVAGVAAGLAVAALAGFQTGRSRLRSLEAERSKLLYERNLLIGNDTPIDRAEKFFLKAHFENKSYHDEQLRQASMMAYLGALFIIAGFVLAAATIAVLAQNPKGSAASSVALAAVGTAAGILSNFVAISLVKMHATTVETLKEFHTRMAEMLNAHLVALERARAREAGEPTPLDEAPAAEGEPKGFFAALRRYR